MLVAGLSDFLSPFTTHPLKPLALYPYSDWPLFEGAVQDIRRDVRDNRPGVFAAYANASYREQRLRPAPHCHEEVDVCNFAEYPDVQLFRPRAAMQAMLGKLAGSPFDGAPPHPPRFRACDAAGVGGRAAVNGHAADNSCALRIAFVQRQGFANRRRLLNLPELVAACNAHTWPGRVACSAISLTGGLRSARETLTGVDVLISPHGADLTNGLMLHNGASVIEIMPAVRQSCPCGMFRDLFSAPNDAGKVFYYRVDGRLAPAAPGSLNEPRPSFHSDLVLPWDTLAPLIATIWEVAGNASRYDANATMYRGMASEGVRNAHSHRHSKAA